MRVFVSGGSGVIGRQLVPRLVAAGHQVTASTTAVDKQAGLRELGAEPVVVDLLETEAVAAAVAAAEPDAIVHQATALAGGIDPRHFDRDFVTTNRLRSEGTDNLLAAGRSAGVDLLIAQSFAGWPFARTGGPVKDETDPLDQDPPEQLRSTLEAIKHLEASVAGATDLTGIVLRYGFFYGPDTSLQLDPPGEQIELIARRRLPIVGGGGGIWSFVHVADAAAATVLALEARKAGIYNIVDDDPVAVSDWLLAMAEAIGARPPLRLPRWVGRLAAGETTAVMMCDVRGASNEKAKRDLGWTPDHADWLTGFVE